MQYRKIHIRWRSWVTDSVHCFRICPGTIYVPFAADDPLRRCIAQVTDELAAERPGRRAMAATLL